MRKLILQLLLGERTYYKILRSLVKKRQQSKVKEENPFKSFNVPEQEEIVPKPFTTEGLEKIIKEERTIREAKLNEDERFFKHSYGDYSWLRGRDIIV